MFLNIFKSSKQIARNYLRKGDELFQMQEYKKAISNYKFSLYFVSSAEVHLRIAMVYKELEMMPEALEECSIAAKIDNEDGEILNFIGDCFYNLGINQNAYLTYSQAVRCNKNTRRSYSYYMMGRVLKEAGVWCRALISYTTALQIDPEFTEARKGMDEMGVGLN